MRNFSLLLCLFTHAMFGQEGEKVAFTPAPALTHLLKVTEVPHEATLASIVTETQKRWIRPAEKERWEVADWTDAKRKEILECADALGFLKALAPQKKEYTYCVFLGESVSWMQDRIHTIHKAWNQGVRFENIVFLTGARPLDLKIEPLLEECLTEGAAALKLWQTTSLPQELRNIPLTFIEVPMIQTETGMRRPNTLDTFKAWLEEAPKPGSCLLISNQPYCPYQDVIGRGALPLAFSVETVGSGFNKEENGAIILDTIARWLYALQQNQVTNS